MLFNDPVSEHITITTTATYMPMAKGYVYFATVMDLFSRKVLAWRASITMDAAFWTEAVEEAPAQYGALDIFNTDQGSQFTNETFSGLLNDNGILIGMDGRVSWRDNVFIKRLWRSIRYEALSRA